MDELVPKKYLDTIDDEMRIFKVVFIPCDPNKEIMEERVIQIKERALSAMLDYAKQRFSEQKLIGQNLKKYQESLSKEHSTISPKALEQLSDMTLCEVIPISKNEPKNLYIGTNLIVDDKAVSKQLPINHRATAICFRCGLEQIQVLGDAFISRQFDNDNGFYRLDFTLKDLNESTTWMNVAKGLLLHSDTVLEKTSKELKEEGNELFKREEYLFAICKYRQALQISNNNDLKSQLLSNLSASRLKIGDFLGALNDAENCIRCKPSWNKAYGRKAEALKKLGRDDEANLLFEKAGIKPTE